MITSREQYRFVEIPDGIRVDGGIMPARDVAGDGSWRQLRGEDPAFLMEGVRERNAAIGKDYTTVVMNRALSARRLADVADEIRIMANRRVAPYFVKPFEDVAVHGKNSASSLYTFFPDVRFTAEDLASSAGDFAAGEPLRADPVRALFYDMQRLRSFVIDTADTGYSCSAWEIVTSAYDENQTLKPPSSPSSVVYLYDMIMDTYLEHPTSGCCSIECRLSNGSFSSSLKDTSVADLVSSCKTYAVFHARYSLYNRTTSKENVDEASYSCVPVPCTIADGVASVAAADIMAAADSIIGHYGWKKVGWNQMEYSSQSIEIGIHDLYAVWTLGDHTDISPLGWNWNP